MIIHVHVNNWLGIFLAEENNTRPLFEDIRIGMCGIFLYLSITTDVLDVG
jgi:hypothetical protein